ncbi:protease [Sinorhizobium meliloti]|nr:protease [Sinorhizobium meliloti]RVI27933.1 protease [Sinorhizobium meliloti]RVI45739.1 protease [Sinorhizobium meliloti]RVJ24240.1 protease [Sinorhizobium meliloti]RVK01798.1 protease [Sinorhizobium meliloti]
MPKIYAYGFEKYFGFTSVSAAQTNAALFAMEQSFGSAANDGFSVEGFTKGSFAPGSAGTATIRFAQTALAETSYAFLRFMRQQETFGSPQPMPARQTTIASRPPWHTHLHKLGHALGLKHGYESHVYGATPAQYDSIEYSVLSIGAYVGAYIGASYSYEQFGAPQTS